MKQHYERQQCSSFSIVIYLSYTYTMELNDWIVSLNSFVPIKFSSKWLCTYIYTQLYNIIRFLCLLLFNFPSSSIPLNFCSFVEIKHEGTQHDMFKCLRKWFFFFQKLHSLTSKKHFHDFSFFLPDFRKKLCDFQMKQSLLLCLLMHSYARYIYNSIIDPA